MSTKKTKTQTDAFPVLPAGVHVYIDSRPNGAMIKVCKHKEVTYYYDPLWDKRTLQSHIDELVNSLK